MKRRMVGDVDFEAIKEDRGYDTSPVTVGADAGQQSDGSAEASS